jgi:polyhydroxybutyrate depolymerase
LEKIENGITITDGCRYRICPVYKIGIAFLIGMLVASEGCRPRSTFIADERRKDTQTGSESSPDTQTGSESSPDTQTGSESSPDTQTGPESSSDSSDTLPDSESGLLDCSGLSATPGDHSQTIQMGGVTRSYVLHIPTAYTGVEPAPLIIDYHALTDTGEDQRVASIYPPVVDPEGVVMAFPSGLDGPLGTAWNIGPCCTYDSDDVAFTEAMIEDIAELACIDRRRVYAVGIYIGGGMAYHLACQSANRFAAVASSAFDLAEQTVEDCTPARPITVVSFRSKGDWIVDYEGGPGSFNPDDPLIFLGAVNTFEKWAELNGCTGIASDLGNGCQQYTTSQCDGDAEVMLCTDDDILGDASIAWSVLKEHALP